MNRTLRRTAPAVLAAATALTLAACTGSSSPTGGSTATVPGMPGMPGMNATDMPATTGMSSPTSTDTSATLGPPATGPHNQADVEFATNMIPHHRQAIIMAEMALTQASSQAVKDLAAAIKAAQAPEIATMSGWLKGWGQPVPTADGGGMSQMGGATGSPGMGGMGTQQLDQLRQAMGMAFDRMWLQAMIEHHKGAVAMAQTEVKTGSNPEAKQLAVSIADTQTQEIAKMTTLLGTLG